jgi:hypothetical protein
MVIALQTSVYDPPSPEESALLDEPARAWAARLGAEAVADTAIAFDALETWIKRNPAGRSVWTIDRLQGKWRVGLMCDGERFTASQDAELRGAIRNALTIAAYAGCP